MKKDIAAVCDEIKDLLIAKNEGYGNSALEPVRVFSRASDDEQLLVRLDDKLSRLSKGNRTLESDEEIFKDIIGYLVLLIISRRKNGV